jgi:hypothetical protein
MYWTPAVGVWRCVTLSSACRRLGSTDPPPGSFSGVRCTMQRLIQGPISTRRNVFYIPERLSQEGWDKHFELFTYDNLYVRDGFYKNTMEVIASSEASSRSAGQEYRALLWGMVFWLSLCHASTRCSWNSVTIQLWHRIDSPVLNTEWSMKAPGHLMVICSYSYKPHSHVLLPAGRLSLARACCCPGEEARESFRGSVEDCTQCADRALHVLVAVCTNAVSSLSVLIFVKVLCCFFLMPVFFVSRCWILQLVREYGSAQSFCVHKNILWR